MFCFERDSFKKYGRVFLLRKVKKEIAQKKKVFVRNKCFSCMEENRKRRKQDDVSEMKNYVFVRFF